MIKDFLKSKHQIQTITFDNDKSFSDHTTVVKALNADSFLPDLIRAKIMEKFKTESDNSGDFHLKSQILVLLPVIK
jgi:IS30 family transposase